MKDPCDAYRHTLQITLSTQYPHDETLTDLIKQLLGPWCKSCKMIELNAVRGVDYEMKDGVTLSTMFL